jgi:hypothetical protein
MSENLLSLLQPAMAAPMIPWPASAKTYRIPMSSGATSRSIGFVDASGEPKRGTAGKMSVGTPCAAACAASKHCP